MGRTSKTIAFLAGFLAGVLGYLVVQPSLLACGLLLFVAIGIILLFRRSKFCILFFLIVGLALGFGRARLSEHHVSPSVIDFYNGQTVDIEGVISEVDVRRDKAKYTVTVVEPVVAPIVAGAKGDVLISLDKYPQYKYGDRLKIYGKLEAPGIFDGFSYENYLSRFGIYSVMNKPWVTVVRSGEGSAFWGIMSALQNGFMDRINHLFPEPYASFEAGLLIGARKGIPPDLTAEFNTVGLSHIVAISGFNITVILSLVLWMLKGLPRKAGFWVAVGAVILFTLFVGASPSVTRAAIMGILGLVALHHGRQSNIHLTVLYAAFFMTLWNPKILWWDVGFQLSFAAVMGLIYVVPHLGPWLNRLPETFGIREAIQMTLSAQVMAFPIIAFAFGRFSLIAPLANLLVAFAIPPAMLLGFLALLFSFVFPSLGLVFAFGTSGVLAYVLKVVEVLSKVPLASLSLPTIQAWLVPAYYILLALILARSYLFARNSIPSRIKSSLK